MSEFYTGEGIDSGDVSDTFDNDFQEDSPFHENDFEQDASFHDNDLYHQELPVLDVNAFSRQDIFDSPNPLAIADSYQCPALDLDFGNQHFVEPHSVDGYTRADGTYVDGYFRDGDGNTDVNRAKEAGGGYFRSNPDDTRDNNLG